MGGDGVEMESRNVKKTSHSKCAFTRKGSANRSTHRHHTPRQVLQGSKGFWDGAIDCPVAYGCLLLLTNLRFLHVCVVLQVNPEYHGV